MILGAFSSEVIYYHKKTPQDAASFNRFGKIAGQKACRVKSLPGKDLAGAEKLAGGKSLPGEDLAGAEKLAGKKLARVETVKANPTRS